MSIRLKTTARAISISGGIPRQDSPHLAIVEQATRTSLARDRGNLYLVAESDGPEAICRQIMRAVIEEYKHSGGSVTAGLLTAIRAAHLALYAQNQEAMPEEQVTAGLTCAVIRDQIVYLAQAGPAVAYLYHQGDLRRIPAESPWVTPSRAANFPYATPLGARREVEPDLFRSELRPGDALLLSTTPLVALLSDDQIFDLLADQPASAVIEQLAQAAGPESLSAIVIEIMGEISDSDAWTAQVTLPQGGKTETGLTVETAGPHPPAETGWMGRATHLIDNLTGRGGGGAHRRPQGRPRPMPAAEQPPLFPLEETPAETETPSPESEALPSPSPWEKEPRPPARPEYLQRLDEVPPAAWSYPSPPPATAPPSVPPAATTAEDQPAVKATGSPAAPRRGERFPTSPPRPGSTTPARAEYPATGGLPGLVGSLATLATTLQQTIAGRIRPPARPASDASQPDETENLTPPGAIRPWGARQRLQIGVIGLVLVVFTVIVGILYGREQQNQQRQAEAMALLNQARAHQATALTTGDRATAQAQIAQAIALTDKALALVPDDLAAQDLRNLLQNDQDRINQISRFSERDLLLLYEFPGAEAAPSRVVWQINQLFVLDTGTDRVYKWLLDANGYLLRSELDPVLVRKGDPIGNLIVGDIIAIFWLPGGGTHPTSNLMTLVAGGNLLEYDAQRGFKVLTVQGAANWRKPQAMSGYDGNFYLLDPLLNQILVYREPTSRGYERAPASWLQTPLDLTNAVDMAIDGRIWLLSLDGKVMPLAQGRPQSFVMAGPDNGIPNPAGFYVAPEDKGHIYILDSSHSRIVQLSKAGQIVRYIHPPAASKELFQSLRGLAVDEGKNIAYLVIGNRLYLATLPRLP